MTPVTAPAAEPQWPDRDWISASELATLAGIHYQTVLREITRGNLPAAKHGAWIIQVAGAKTWLAGFEKYQSLRKAPPDN